MSYTGQIVDLADLFFNGPVDINDEAKAELDNDTALPVLKEFRQRIEDIDVFEATCNSKRRSRAFKRIRRSRAGHYTCRSGSPFLTKCTARITRTIELLGRERPRSISML